MKQKQRRGGVVFVYYLYNKFPGKFHSREQNTKKAPIFCEPYWWYGEQKIGAFDKVMFREGDLPSKVGKGAVGLGHLVYVFTLLDCISFFLGSEHKLLG